MPKKEKTKKLSLEEVSKKIAELTGIVDGCLKFVTKLAEDLRPALTAIQTDLSTHLSDIKTTATKVTDLEYTTKEIKSKLINTIHDLNLAMGTFENYKLNSEPILKSIEHPAMVTNSDKVVTYHGRTLGEILVYSEFINTMVSSIAEEAIEKGEFKLNPKKAIEILLALGFFVPSDTDLEEHKESNDDNPFNKEDTDNDDNGHSIL